MAQCNRAKFNECGAQFYYLSRYRYKPQFKNIGNKLRVL